MADETLDRTTPLEDVLPYIRVAIVHQRLADIATGGGNGLISTTESQRVHHAPATTVEINAARAGAAGAVNDVLLSSHDDVCAL